MSTIPPWRAVPYGQFKSLNDWNCERQQFWEDSRLVQIHPDHFFNGLTCPRCESLSLYDTGKVESTKPTMLRVACTVCTYKGNRYE